MKYLSSNEIRNMWLSFFEEKKHHILNSASLIPKDDPTLLWINAGVAPLKSYFDGTKKPVSNRLTNIQKCIRTNDIENVGLTSRHHTFFEMLGNFSIGDYFKEEAITYAYELLFSEKYFNFPKDKIYITYYTNDLDCKNIWLKLGIKETHLISIDDNYWEIGEGPSGPNTEIFFDRGKSFDERGIELIKEDIENDRFIEIWNIVFSQYNAKEGLKRSEYPELPNKNIDTGAGLERIASIFQNTKTNFETDLFLPIIKEIELMSNIKYDGQTSFKVISDHIKTLVFAINDGAMLSNEGRGYVLRRILRRALKYGRDLKLYKPFLHKLVDVVIKTMDGFYNDLNKNKEIIEKIILNEEVLFLKTIDAGEKLFFDLIKNSNVINGKDAFKLYDTYGFPIELTLEYASDNNIEVDLDDFYKELNKQKERSRKARTDVSSMKTQNEKFINFNLKSEFVGYDKVKVNSKVIKVFEEGIVLDKTPFYATSGGQVHDIGTINNIDVKDVYKLPNNQHLHVLSKEHNLKENDLVEALVDVSYRENIIKNHTATHLLHQALKDVLGNHVNQQGSLVNNELLRFDFNHFENLTNDEILKIEAIIKDKINKHLTVKTNLMKLEDAKNIGAKALFNEKYDDLVRVVNIDNYSIELCGGIHVSNTKDIKDFAVVSIESIGSGIYRIIATTNGNILKLMKDNSKHIINEINVINKNLKELNDSKQFKLEFNKNSYINILNNNNIIVKAKKYLNDIQKLQKQKKVKEAISNIDNLLPTNPTNKEVIVIEGFEKNTLKQLIDSIYDKINAELVLLINKLDDEFVALVKSNGKIHAGNLIKELMNETNGRGGGRDTFAQGGSKDLTNLDEAIKRIKDKL